MRRLVQLALKIQFCQKYLQRGQKHFISTECVKIRKKTLKSNTDPMFLAKCGHSSKCASIHIPSAIVHIPVTSYPSDVRHWDMTVTQ